MQRLEMGGKSIATASIQAVIDALSKAGFFEQVPSSQELEKFGRLLGVVTSAEGTITVTDLYNCVNKAVASNNIEGKILLRVSKFFTGIFALFMGFIAVFLLASPVDSLGHVYMSMGVLVGSAVGPAALTILMERANGKAVAAGAIGGFVLGILGWTLRALDEFDEVDYGTMMADWPWVVGNLCAILGGGLIALTGSLIAPDNEFRWAMLNDRIPLVDDVEPPKDDKETDDKMNQQVKIAIAASVVLTIVLLVLWPLPLHAGGGVFSEAGFSVWVVLQFLWAIIGGAVIIILPGYEIVRSFMGKDKPVGYCDATMVKFAELEDPGSPYSPVERAKPPAQAASAQAAPAEATDQTPRETAEL